ncbi:hypothetical protein CSOJ01_11817 [Colletotrichum sojae]|uniref:Zn(2)-C6 fungal-type domain-containing protein n=1 Tax=Colletotrichum sojae TaxID=2175907 RepID=A0A8H6IWD3_9PEZI|nr:hypothetical protein CSOJ01_11817 [Colletotrichum sojae]
MTAQFYHRSRNGCLTCRGARIKCDERRPLCRQCERRGVPCDGYKVQLKWVEASDVNPDSRAPAKSVVKPRSSLAMCPSRSAAAAASRNPSGKAAALRTAAVIVRNPASGPRLDSPADVFIFTHWAQSLPDLVYPNPADYGVIRDPYIFFVWKPESILLPAVLAAGAAHLHALGILKQADVLERKQRALNKMVACVRERKSSPTPQGRPGSLPLYVSEEAIAASLSLVGLEIMHGSETSVIRPLLRGMRAQLEDRRRALASMVEGHSMHRPTPMMAINVKMMAYMDAMSCVPCARRPLLDRQFWRDEIMPFGQGGDISKGPDMVFGYSTKILPLIGDAAALVHDLFSGMIAPEEFALDRYFLVQELAACCRELPPAVQQPACADGGPGDPTGSLAVKNGNACISAALAFALATQVFLLRASGGEASAARISPSSNPTALAEQLADAVAGVPPDSFASTMMAWPVFVLGCESAPMSSRRYLVEALYEKMVQKHRLLNMSAAIEALRTKIWRTDGDASSPTASLQYRQSDWVRHCWQEKLQLCMA